MHGYGNALSFKNIGDAEIDYIEKYTKENAMDILTRKFCDESHIHEKCDVLIDDDIMCDHFGERFASTPTEFSFRSGDRFLIRECVKHVKLVVDRDGINRGLSHFKQKQSNKKQLQIKGDKLLRMDMTSGKLENSELHSILKHKLFEKVKCTFNQYKAITPDQMKCFTENNVSVIMNNTSSIFGEIICILCQSTECDQKNQKPKRVYYHLGKKF